MSITNLAFGAKTAYFLIKVIMLALLLPMKAFASELNGHSDPAASVILGLTLIFFIGAIGRFFALKCKQPRVLGEILIGVVAGNIAYFFGMQIALVLRESPSVFLILKELLSGVDLAKAVKLSVPDPFYAAQMLAALSSPQGADYFKIAYVVDIFSRYGVLFLLFMVGLHSSVEEIKHTGKEALFVAVIGVAAPMILGYSLALVFIPGSAFSTNLFIGAALSATSIGITASVLKDMKILHLIESKTILSAAMLDDILGLIILAVVSNLVVTGIFDFVILIKILFMVAIFFIAVLWMGPFLIKKTITSMRIFEVWETKIIVSFILLTVLSWLANAVELAMIIGAFTAGLLINDKYFHKNEQDHLSINTLFTPLEAIFAPLFFILIGIQVKLESFFSLQVLSLSFGLIAVAIIGKLVSGLGANKKNNRLFIGIGMLPRGEVGLVFAAIGRNLGVITDTLFSAIILMVILTTLITPPLLKICYKRTNMVNKT